MTAGRSDAGSRPILAAFVTTAALFSLGCDASEPSDPHARSVTLTPASDDGAAWVRLVGAPVSSISADDGEVYFASHGDTTEVVLILSEPGRIAFDLRVEDPTRTPVGNVVQVADGENRLRDAAAYRAEVRP